MDISKLNELDETSIQTLILDYLNKNGVFAFRINTMGVYDAKIGGYRRPGKFSLAGVSDILGVMPDGRMLAIETKTRTGKASREQVAFINKINERNGLAFIARSIEDVRENLKWQN